MRCGSVTSSYPGPTASGSACLPAGATAALVGRQRRYCAAIRSPVAGQPVKLQVEKDLPQPLTVRLTAGQVVEVQLDRRVQSNRHQLLRQAGIVRVFEQRVSHALALDLIGVGQDLLQAAEPFDEAGCRLLADATHTRDVVGRVADQRQVVGDVPGIDPEALDGVLRGDPLLVDSRGSAAARIEEVRHVIDELIEVLVARHDHGPYALLRRLSGQRPDHVVRFPVGDLDHGNAEGFHDFAHPGQRGGHLVGHLLSRGLVLRIDFRAVAVTGVQHHPHVVGIVVLHESDQKAGEAERSRGVFAARGGQRPADHGEERAIDEGVSVQQVQGWRVVRFTHLQAASRLGRVAGASENAGAPNRVGRGAADGF